MSESLWSKFVNGTKKVFKEGKKAVKVVGASVGAFVGGVGGTLMILDAISGLATGGVTLIPSLVSGLVGAGCIGLGLKSFRIAKEAFYGQDANQSNSSNKQQTASNQEQNLQHQSGEQSATQEQKPSVLEKLKKGAKGAFEAATSKVGIATIIACAVFPALVPFAMIAAAYSGYKSMQTKAPSEGHIPNQNSPQPQNSQQSFKDSPAFNMQQKLQQGSQQGSQQGPSNPIPNTSFKNQHRDKENLKSH
jgi:hypothetical protein